MSALVAAAPALAVSALMIVAAIGTAAACQLTAARLSAAALHRLATAAREIVREGRADIAYLDRRDDRGELARALEGWQRAAAEGEILRRAPVGIARVDRLGLLRNVNLAAESMLGYEPGEMEGMPVLDLIAPEDLHRSRARRRALSASRIPMIDAEDRNKRKDGSRIWCSVTVAPVRWRNGKPDSFIIIWEDIDERKRQAERDARAQRQLLPHDVPPLPGYDLAGGLVPAQGVAGDFYDWTPVGDGQIDLTLADVTARGMGTALLMAVLRTAMRTADGRLGPAERVARAAASMAFGDEPLLSVALFHGRLDLATGALRYVNLGLQGCFIRRAAGDVASLAGAASPLELGGPSPTAGCPELLARLEPGDCLVAHSGGVAVGADDHVFHADGTDSGAQAVRELLQRVPAPADDLTAIVLRRAGAPVTASGGA